MSSRETRRSSRAGAVLSCRCLHEGLAVRQPQCSPKVPEKDVAVLADDGAASLLPAPDVKRWSREEGLQGRAPAQSGRVLGGCPPALPGLSGSRGRPGPPRLPSGGVTWVPSIGLAAALAHEVVLRASHLFRVGSAPIRFHSKRAKRRGRLSAPLWSRSHGRFANCRSHVCVALTHDAGFRPCCLRCGPESRDFIEDCACCPIMQQVARATYVSNSNLGQWPWGDFLLITPTLCST
jgi:hypothetical protein